MDKIILKDGYEIPIHEGSSLTETITDVANYTDLKQLVEELKTDNLTTVKFKNESGSVTAEYNNMELIGPCVNVSIGAVLTVTFGLRERSEQEMQQENVYTAISYLTDEQAATVSTLYPEWQTGIKYKIGDRRRYNDILYRCLQEHESQENWIPTDSPSLWAKILTDPAGGVLPWEHPDSTNPYKKGDRVTHNGKTWESDVDNNVWEPGVVGTESLWHVVNE